MSKFPIKKCVLKPLPVYQNYKIFWGFFVIFRVFRVHSIPVYLREERAKHWICKVWYLALFLRCIITCASFLSENLLPVSFNGVVIGLNLVCCHNCLCWTVVNSVASWDGNSNLAEILQVCDMHMKNQVILSSFMCFHKFCCNKKCSACSNIKVNRNVHLWLMNDMYAKLNY